MMWRVLGALHRNGFLRRNSSVADGALPPASDILPGSRIAPESRPAYQTHDVPVYSLPYYGAAEETVVSISDHDVSQALKSYGGLLRKDDTREQRRDRLLRITRDRLTIAGLVVSDKMDKSVVVAARRRAFAKKLRKEYTVTRRFMAHDEQDLCREGDRVIIRSCRPMSRWKSHVVVRNYGDKTQVGVDDRAERLIGAIASREVAVPEN